MDIKISTNAPKLKYTLEVNLNFDSKIEQECFFHSVKDIADEMEGTELGDFLLAIFKIR